MDGAPAGETDDAGRFSLAVTTGPHVVQVQQPGMEPLTLTLTAPAVDLVLRLEPTGAGPRYESVVRPPAPEASRTSLQKEEMTTTPGSLGDPFRVIESLPGVTPIVWPLAVYAIRGANPGNTGFFLDGLRVPGLFHFALGPAVVHPYFLESLDFYPGGYPARHGRYVSGIVAASTMAPPSDRVHGSIDLRLFDVGGIVTAPIDGGRGTVAVAGRYGYPAALLSALSQNVDFQYWDYQARADYRVGPGKLTLLAFGSYDLLEPQLATGTTAMSAMAMAGSTTTPAAMPAASASTNPRLALTFHRIDLRWRGSLGKNRVFAAVGVGRDETAVPFERSDIGATGKSLLPRLTLTRALGDWADLEVGADGELVDYDTRLGTSGAAAAAFARPRDVALVGAFSSLVLRPHPRLVLVPGVRADLYSESDARQIDVGPRLNVRVQSHEAIWWKLSGGRMTQMPSLPLQLPGFEGFGLGQMGLQTAWQGAAGFEAELPGGFSMDASGFLHRYKLTDIRDPELGDPLLDDFLTQRDALSYGLELMLRRAVSERLHGWLSYTLSRSLRAFEGGVVAPADWDSRHVLNLVASYRLRRWTLGGRVHMHTGRPVKIANTNPPDYGRLPAFYQLDLRVERRFVFDRFTLDVYLEVINTTLTNQVVQLRKTPQGVVGDGFRFVLPSLGVRAEL